MSNTPDIIFTQVDEAPPASSSSIIQAFTHPADISIGVKDIP